MLLYLSKLLSVCPLCPHDLLFYLYRHHSYHSVSTGIALTLLPVQTSLLLFYLYRHHSYFSTSTSYSYAYTNITRTVLPLQTFTVPLLQTSLLLFYLYKHLPHCSASTYTLRLLFCVYNHCVSAAQPGECINHYESCSVSGCDVRISPHTFVGLDGIEIRSNVCIWPRVYVCVVFQMVFSSGVVQIRLDRFTVNRDNIAMDTCCQANTCRCGIRMRACVFDRNDTRCDDASLQTSDLIGESSCFAICCITTCRWRQWWVILLCHLLHQNMPVTSMVNFLALSFVASQHAGDVSGESYCFVICCGDLPGTSWVSHLSLLFVASQHAGDVSGESSCCVICCITTC